MDGSLTKSVKNRPPWEELGPETLSCALLGCRPSSGAVRLWAWGVELDLVGSAAKTPRAEGPETGPGQTG